VCARGECVHAGARVCAPEWAGHAGGVSEASDTLRLANREGGGTMITTMVRTAEVPVPDASTAGFPGTAAAAGTPGAAARMRAEEPRDGEGDARVFR